MSIKTFSRKVYKPCLIASPLSKRLIHNFKIRGLQRYFKIHKDKKFHKNWEKSTRDKLILKAIDSKALRNNFLMHFLLSLSNSFNFINLEKRKHISKETIEDTFHTQKKQECTIRIEFNIRVNYWFLFISFM